ncbi:clathrin coat assembly protein AP180-like [Panthera pardus]|uniref:Clathrin coat assembly protein AP180-like n=1 Tax=Panthera pardus TaxID=9691 RepID=A0A9V1F483_PANPR|nr:clathrin coat assembly protein AP180-like [Panthera pardus]
MGSFASKAALRATTDEPTEPEPKHLADLIQYVNETNMSVEHLADVLSEKARSSSWVVVFTALVTVHHLMVHGNEVSVLYIQWVILSFLLAQRTVSTQWQNILGLSRLAIFYFATPVHLSPHTNTLGILQN